MKLADRLKVLMDAKDWQHADLVAVSGMSSSVVSQWLGHGSKEIKSIGNIQAAIRLQQASGFSALWLAVGMEPQRIADCETPSMPVLAREAPAAYRDGLAGAVMTIASSLANTTATTRSAAGSLLSSLAEKPHEAESIARQLAALVDSGKQHLGARRSA